MTHITILFLQELLYTINLHWEKPSMVEKKQKMQNYEC